MRSRTLFACGQSLLILAAVSLSLSCGHSPSQVKAPVSAQVQPSTAAKLTVGSKTFTNGAPLPKSAVDTCPELHWSNPPAGTKSIAIVVEDPDAPGGQPFAHFLVANYPPELRSMPPKKAQTMTIGLNDNGSAGYYGPHPPKGSGVHHYHFEIFALKEKLKLNVGFKRQELMDAMKGKVLANGEVVGTFSG
jgi:hypothetical protein